MKKCEVLADRISLVVGKGSVVEVDDIQFELARQYLKPIGKVEEKKADKPVEEEQAEQKKSKKK